MKDFVFVFPFTTHKNIKHVIIFLFVKMRVEWLIIQ